MTFGQRIKERRLQLNLSQNDVGVGIGAYNVTVGGWERDAYLPSLLNFYKLMDFLGMEISKQALKEYLGLNKKEKL